MTSPDAPQRPNSKHLKPSSSSSLCALLAQYPIRQLIFKNLTAWESAQTIYATHLHDEIGKTELTRYYDPLRDIFTIEELARLCELLNDPEFRIFIWGNDIYHLFARVYNVAEYSKALKDAGALSMELDLAAISIAPGASMPKRDRTNDVPMKYEWKPFANYWSPRRPQVQTQRVKTDTPDPQISLALHNPNYRPTIAAFHRNRDYCQRLFGLDDSRSIDMLSQGPPACIGDSAWDSHLDVHEEPMIRQEYQGDSDDPLLQCRLWYATVELVEDYPRAILRYAMADLMDPRSPYSVPLLDPPPDEELGCPVLHIMPKFCGKGPEGDMETRYGSKRLCFKIPYA
ncbi:MAG: hypothetical protein Q9227_001892 [Pyrenula ochraceoflavens]